MNRETYPASLSPMTGDAVAGVGAKQTTVVGIQNTPIASTTPNDQDVLRFNFTDGAWEPTADPNVAIFINGVPVSDDPVVYINAGPLVQINGV